MCSMKIVCLYRIASVTHAKPDDKMLMDASKRGDTRKFKLALDNDADLSQTDSDGMTVLHNAARFNCKDICALILEKASVEFINALDREK